MQLHRSEVDAARLLYMYMAEFQRSFGGAWDDLDAKTLSKEDLERMDTWHKCWTKAFQARETRAHHCV